MKHTIIVLVMTTLVFCQPKPDLASIEQEIWETEKSFAEKVKNEGMAAGFLAYAADSAVLLRGNQLIKGKKSIAAYFDRLSLDSQRVQLTWKPDFVEVSGAGDLAYTYGSYRYQVTDSAGQAQVNEGIFHTVWKKQNDGTWKYVWD